MGKSTKEKKKISLKMKCFRFIRFLFTILICFWINDNVVWHKNTILSWVAIFLLSVFLYDMFSFLPFFIYLIIANLHTFDAFNMYSLSTDKQIKLLFFSLAFLLINFIFWLIKRSIKATEEDNLQKEKDRQEIIEWKEKLALMEYKEFYNIKEEIKHPFNLEEVLKISEYKENREFLECDLDFIFIKNSQKLKYFIDIINVYNYYKEKINKICDNNLKNVLLIQKNCKSCEKHYDVFYKPSKNDWRDRSLFCYSTVKQLADLKAQQICYDAYGIELDFYYLIDHYIPIIKNKYNEILENAIITKKGIDGEYEVLNTLKKYNDGSYQILENIRLKSYNTNIANSSEADVIIISKKGIFVLEIKNYGDDGNYTLAINKDGRWVKQYDNGNIVPIEKSPELQNIEHANTIKRTLKEELGREFLVYGMVIISNNNVNIINNRDYPVLRKEFIIPEIEKYDDILNEKDVNDIVTTLSANNLGEGTFSAVNYRKELIDVIQQFYWELNDFFAQKEGLIKNIFDFYINKVKELNNAEYELHIFKEKRDNYTLNIFEMKMKEIFKTNNCINRIETEKSINRYNTLNKSNNIEDDYIK